MNLNNLLTQFFQLKEVFEKYASIEENGEKFMTNEDFVVKYLRLLPEENYNHETLDIFAGVIDCNKDNRISFGEFSAFERNLCQPDALYRTSFQLFDTNGGGSVSFSEFKEIMSKENIQLKKLKKHIIMICCLIKRKLNELCWHWPIPF